MISSLNIVSLFEWFALILIFHDAIVPVKYEHVVFCGLSELQLSLYRLFISSPEIKALLRGTNSQPLKAINILKKLCNHPQLLDLPNDLKGSDHLIPSGFTGAGGAGKGRGQEVHCEWSGKFLVLERYGCPLVGILSWNCRIDSCFTFGRRLMTKSFS